MSDPPLITSPAVVSDVWWDVGPESSRLRLIMDGPRGRRGGHFWFVVHIGEPMLVRFDLLAWVKGQAIFEATEWRPADTSGSPSPAPLCRPYGPYPGATSNAP